MKSNFSQLCGNPHPMPGFLLLLLFILLSLSGGWNYHLNAQPKVEIPLSKMPVPNAYDFYVRAAKVFVKRPEALSKAYSRKTEEELWAYLRQPAMTAWSEANRPALETLRQGFAYECRVPTTRGEELAIGSGPLAAQFFELTIYLWNESHYQAAQGNWRAATECALDTLQLGHDLRRGAGAVDVYTSDLVIGKAGSLKAFIPHLDAATLRYATERLQNLHDNRVPFAQTLRQHKRGMQSGLSAMMKKPDWVKRVIENLSRDDNPPRLPASLDRTITMRNLASYADAHIADAERPWPQRKTIKAPDPISEIVFVSSYLSRRRWAYAKSETHFVQRLTVIALPAYYLKQGTYPTKLDDLVPKYLKSVPLDPFDGKPLRYKRQGKDYFLWSVGPDGKDDVGLPAINSRYHRSSEPEAIKNSVLGKFTLSSFYIVEEDSEGDFVFGINN